MAAALAVSLAFQLLIDAILWFVWGEFDPIPRGRNYAITLVFFGFVWLGHRWARGIFVVLSALGALYFLLATITESSRTWWGPLMYLYGALSCSVSVWLVTFPDSVSRYFER